MLNAYLHLRRKIVLSILHSTFKKLERHLSLLYQSLVLWNVYLWVFV